MQADFGFTGLGATGIKVEIKSEFRKRLERKGQQNAIFSFSGVVADDGAEGSNPVCQIAIDRVALLLQGSGLALVLFLHTETPVITYPIVTADDKEIAVVEVMD